MLKENVILMLELERKRRLRLEGFTDSDDPKVMENNLREAAKGCLEQARVTEEKWKRHQNDLDAISKVKDDLIKKRDELTEVFKYGQQLNDVRAKWAGCDQAGANSTDPNICIAGYHKSGKNSCGKTSEGGGISNVEGYYSRGRYAKYSGGNCHYGCQTKGWDETIPETMKNKIREGCLASFTERNDNKAPPGLKASDFTVTSKNHRPTCNGSYSTNFYCEKSAERIASERTHIDKIESDIKNRGSEWAGKQPPSDTLACNLCVGINIAGNNDATTNNINQINKCKNEVEQKLSKIDSCKTGEVFDVAKNACALVPAAPAASTPATSSPSANKPDTDEDDDASPSSGGSPSSSSPSADDDGADDNDESTDAAPTSSKKKWIIIAVVVLILIAAGAAFFMFKKRGGGGGE